MDRMNWKEAALFHWKKYRLGLTVLALGLLLMLLPQEKPQTAIAPEEKAAPTLEQSLSAALSTMEGAGKVQVLLTQSRGEEILYQTDADVSASETARDSRETTVRITGTDRAETGLVRQVNPPEYLGALVLCQGADDPKVKLAIVEAVMGVTGLRSDKISVLKMK